MMFLKQQLFISYCYIWFNYANDVNDYEQELLRRNEHFFAGNGEKKELLKKVLSSSTLSELDPFLARLCGHEDEFKYYEAISCTDYNHFQVPSLFVQPADDPLHMVSQTVS
jgi:predicted alpha/beta-fold hydrolase